MTVSEGPRRAVRTGDQAADFIWLSLVHLYGFKDHWTEYAAGQENALVSALFWITDEPHDSIRARAGAAVVVSTENEEN